MPRIRQMKVTRKTWTEARIEGELRQVAASIGSFPSCQDLRYVGKNDLACQVSRNGGFLAWSERLGIPRRHSDSDTGWDGEIAVMEAMRARGLKVERQTAVKAPYDLLVNGSLRVDVKAARFATYKNGKSGEACAGWFFRIGKQPQADIILFYKLDTGGIYPVPWWDCPTSNVTITPTGHRYAKYENNWSIIDRMLEMRTAERADIDAANVC